jgi:formylglycine-generating enzyme required for sulfatase activity
MKRKKIIQVCTFSCLLFFVLLQSNCTAQGALADLQAGMVKVQGGTFTMGCTAKQGDCAAASKPSHTVTVSTFYISKFDVTQAQWEAVMGTNPSHFNNCPNCPVENVSWNDAMAFIAKLNAKTGKKYRLPTEAEWEFAARGGNNSKGYKYAGGNDIDAVAWYKGNSGGKTQPVGQKQPNELGLYDMTGGVWQWCSDWRDDKYYAISPANDPRGPASGEVRVARGSCWNDIIQNCSVSLRGSDAPSVPHDVIGFRLAEDR